MTSEPKVECHRHGLPEEITRGSHPGEAPATALVKHFGLTFAFRFERGDLAGAGELMEIWIRPGDEQLTPKALRQFAPHAERYLAYARAAMRWGAPPFPKDDSKAPDLEKRNEDFLAASDALRSIAGPGRALSDEFYRGIARHHDELVSEGEPHPIKTIGEVHHVTISAASRWVKEAKRRGYVKATT